ncbi:MAG: IclR family transcriptional regulator [Anaerolineae bacterium]
MGPNYRIAAVEKTLDILEFLGQNNQEFGLPELSQALRIPKVTLFRYLHTLEQRKYVRKNPENDKYVLGLKILELSSHALDSLSVHEVALPYMRELQSRFEETVNLAVLEGAEVVYIEILESPRAFKMSSHVGGRELPHSTSLGKAMLAFLPDEEVKQIVKVKGLPKRTENTISTEDQLQDELAAIRQRGYAIDDEENEIGARCVGVPIFDRRGRAIAAISLSGPAFRFSPAEVEAMGTALQNAAARISERIGYMDRHM